MDYSILFLISIVIVAFAGFAGNIIVIIVYIFDRNLHSFTNYFFVNLSIVDILIVIVCLPVGIFDVVMEGVWIFGKFYCHFEVFVEGVLLSVSSLTLISISIERFLAISRPLHNQKRAKQRRKVFDAKNLKSSWAIFLIYLIAPFLIELDRSLMRYFENRIQKFETTRDDLLNIQMIQDLFLSSFASFLSSSGGHKAYIKICPMIKSILYLFEQEPISGHKDDFNTWNNNSGIFDLSLMSRIFLIAAMLGSFLKAFNSIQSTRVNLYFLGIK
ncbi:orexin receptor type 2 [Brachionus plicatilis]|uniref:Orexin receptor type 2 n=1 Tax=Brachionus plicatilis TaxID=10195 RepID=A0A3M7PF51_BRAPC|nr:orexin receptor type 2 [Brachionus plicatilis]